MQTRMTPDDTAIIDGTDKSILPTWWVLLNKWKWPEALPDEEPKEYHQFSRRGDLMDYIEKKVGAKECSFAWHRDQGTNHTTRAAHNKWWETRLNP